MKRKVLTVLGLKSILLSGLLLGVVSCRTNDTDNAVNGTGKPLAVRMNLLGADFEDDSGGEASRSSVAGGLAPKIVSISPSEFIRVSNESVPNSGVSGSLASSGSTYASAGDPLASGIKFRVLVYDANKGNTYVTHQDYEVGSQPAPMMLDDGGNYTVVAYSYNDNWLPNIGNDEKGTLSGARVDYRDGVNRRDFMHYRGNIKPNATSANTLNIKLRHKIANVTVVVNNITSSPITTITGATLGPHYTDAKFNLSNGNIVNPQNIGSGLSLNFPGSAAVTRTATPVFINSGATSGTTTSHAASFTGDITIGGVTKPISLSGLFSIKPGYRQTFNVNLSKCGAYLGASSSNWKEFMCWNLGADTSLDPFVPAAGIHGAKYQWGYKPSNANAYDGRYYTQAKDQSDSGVTSNWNKIQLPNGSWSDTSKTANDPCPTGYRVPTRTQWDAVRLNNQIGIVGAWIQSATNYGSGINIGGNGNSTLFLPAAGSRGNYDAMLFNRGLSGHYWSSSETATSTATASFLYLSNINFAVRNENRTYGFSVRCVAE